MSKAQRNRELIENSQYEELVKENTNLIHSILMKNYPHVKIDSYEYQDMFSDAMFAMYKAAINFNLDSGYAFSTFAARCILNQIRLTHRLSKKHDDVVIVSLYTTPPSANIKDSINDKNITLLDCIEDPEDKYFPIKQKAFITALKASLLELPEKDRDVFIMKYINGMKQREIAAKLGITQSYACRIIQRSKTRLKRSLLRRGIDQFFFND